MSKKKATSSDVAKRAGVSQATVSMVLNKKYNVSFSRETVEKVEQAARELGYHLPGRKNRTGPGSIYGDCSFVQVCRTLDLRGNHLSGDGTGDPVCTEKGKAHQIH